MAPRSARHRVLPDNSAGPTGNAADIASGIESVACNGIAACLDGQRYTCAVPVNAGTNAVQIVAEDRAGNSTTKNAVINVADPPPPTSMHITPAKMTLLAGTTQDLRVTDQADRPISGGTFTSLDPTIAQVEITEGRPFARGMAPERRRSS